MKLLKGTFMKKINLLLLITISSLTLVGCIGSTSSDEIVLSQGWNKLGGSNNIASGATIIKINPQTNFLYAAGSAYESNYSVGMVNQWNGTSWSQIGNYILGYVGERQQSVVLTALALNQQSSELYVGGYNWTGVCQNSLTGEYWSSCGLSFLSVINSLAMGTNGSLYASGATNFNGQYRDNTYMLSDLGSGKQWYTIGQNSAAISNLVVDNLNNVYGTAYNASGGGVWKYNSQTDLWVQLGNYFIGTAQQIAVSSNGSLYVGSSDSASNPEHGGVRTWNGSNWAFVGGGYIPGVQQFDSITVDDSGNVYVGGYSANGGGVWKWDGSSWSQIGGAGALCNDGMANVGSVAVDTIGNIYAVCGSSAIGGNIYVHQP